MRKTAKFDKVADKVSGEVDKKVPVETGYSGFSKTVAAESSYVPRDFGGIDVFVATLVGKTL